MARPTKLTPAVERAVVAAIRKGATYRLAAMAAGIHYDTLRDWLRKGESGEAEFSAFSEAVAKAEAEIAVKALGWVTKAASRGSYRAGMWLLERRYPNDYGRRDPADDTDDGSPDGIAVDLFDAVPPELEDHSSRNEGE